jgi:transposase
MATAHALVQDFMRMVRARADLDRWRAAAAARGVADWVSCVKGVRRDVEAVAAAFTAPHSHGQVDGQGLRVKLLKRQTNGRATCNLLRRRVLYHAA